MTDVAQPELRGQLSRDTIIRTAIEMIERDGDDAVSMRRIAAELRYGVMSLYNHVPSKEALLDAVAERVLGEFDFSADPGADWRDQARALVRTFRQLSRRYPRSLNVVITRQLNSTAGLQPLEAALATARAAGFHGETAVRIMRAFVAYALGSLVLSKARADLHGHPDRVDAARFPNIAELGTELMRIDPDADFEFGLELLIGAVAGLARLPDD